MKLDKQRPVNHTFFKLNTLIYTYINNNTTKLVELIG